MISKYLRLMVRMNREEPITVVCYFIMLFLTAFLIDFSISSLMGAGYGLKLLSAYEDGLCFSYFLDVDSNAYEETEDKIRQMKEVESIGTIRTGIYPIENKSEALGLFQYNQDLLKNSHFLLEEGFWFNNPDEVVLAASAKKVLRLGDQINVLLEDGTKKRLKVTGFLKNDQLIQGTAVAERRNKAEWFFENSVTDMYQHHLSMNWVCGIVAPECTISGLLKKTTFYVKLKETDDINRVLENAERIAGDQGVFYTLKEGMGSYRKSYLTPQNREEFFFLICVLVLFIVGFCVNNVLRIYNKKKEFAVYYLTGLTWEGSILLSYLKSLLLFAVAIPAGILVLHIMKAKGIFFALECSWGIDVMIFLFLFLGYMVFSLPVYFLFKKKDPIELLKKEDGI